MALLFMVLWSIPNYKHVEFFHIFAAACEIKNALSAAAAAQCKPCLPTDISSLDVPGRESAPSVLPRARA